MDGFAIQAIEADPRPGNRECANETLDAGVFRVRDGYTATNAGRSKLFALENRLDDVLDFSPFEVTGAPQASHHLPDNAFLGGGSQFRDHGIPDDKISHAHANASYRRPAEIATPRGLCQLGFLAGFLDRR